MMQSTPQFVHIPLPSIGGKCWLLEAKGTFVLERGPGTIRTLAVTHAGSGHIEVIDGVPNERGFFSDQDMVMPEPFTTEEWKAAEALMTDKSAKVPTAVRKKYEAHVCWGERVGRPFYRANPIVMGSWMLDAGFIHGLTIRATGADAVNMTASIVWMPYKARG